MELKDATKTHVETASCASPEALEPFHDVIPIHHWLRCSLTLGTEGLGVGRHLRLFLQESVAVRCLDFI